MLAEAVIKKKSTPGGCQSPLIGSPATSMQLQMRKPEPFANLLNVVRSHTNALKEATKKSAPPPLLNFDVGKENLSNFPRMLAEAVSLKDPPQHLREDVDLSFKILKANCLARRNNINEAYSVSHMGSSTTGEFCKVVKVVSSSSSPLSITPSKTMKTDLLPSTRLMSIPEFEGKLEKLKKLPSERSSTDGEATYPKTSPAALPDRETETPSSEQYETADHYDSGTDRSSALSRFSDSTAISSFAGEGETFDATDADITVVSSLAS